MSSELAKTEEPVQVVTPPSQPSPEANAAVTLLDKATDYLARQDEGMAAAAFLDASDLGHPEATIKSALLYYVGVGITRNLQTAREYAQKYLAIAPQGPYATAAREIIDESLGTENGRRILFGESSKAALAIDENAKTGGRKLILIGSAAAAFVILLVAAGLFWSDRKAHSLSDEKIEISSLIPNEERDAAKRDALAIAATLKADALTSLKKAEEEQNVKKAADAAATEQARITAEKAEQDANAEQDARLAQAQAAQAQAQAAEVQAHAQAVQTQSRNQAAQAQAVQAQVQARNQAAQAQAEQAQAAQARAAQAQGRTVPSSGQQTQLRTMYDQAVAAARGGDYDRAIGIADSMLAISANNATVMNLKSTLQQKKKQALNQ